jgi:hypothetical protein
MTPEFAAEMPLGEPRRLAAMFFAPAKAFADIARRPRWFVPVILLTILALAFTFSLSQRIGFEQIVRHSIDQSSRAQGMSAEQRDRAVSMGAKIGSIMGFVGAAVGPTITVLITAAILMFIANGMLGAQMRYVQMQAITAYSFFTTGLVSTPLSIAVLYLKNPDDFDVRNPLAFNAGAFLSGFAAGVSGSSHETLPAWLIAFASSFDLFTFWTMALLAIGISVAGRKVSVGKAFGSVFISWLAFVLLKTGWVALFG